MHRFAPFAILLCVCTLGACATIAPTVLPHPTAGGLTASLANRERVLESMQTPAVMEYTSGKQHIKAREQIVVRRPALLRVDALSPMGVALVVAANNDHIAVYNPSENTLIQGPATAQTLARFTRIPMAPQAAVRLLLALTPERRISGLEPVRTAEEGGMKVVVYSDGNGVTDELGFKDGQLAMVRRRLADGRTVYEVHYSDYRNIGAMAFPYSIEANFPLAGTKISLRYERPIIDQAVPDSTFVLTPGPSTKRVNLSLYAVRPAVPEG